MDDLPDDVRQQYLADEALIVVMLNAAHWQDVDAAKQRTAANPYWHPVDSANAAHDARQAEQANGYGPGRNGGRR